MSQARYHGRMKIHAHLRDLNVYRNLERLLQFSEDIWNAFYQSEVQLKAARQLKEIIEQLAKAKKAKEFGRFDCDLKALELKLAECESVMDEVGDPPLKFLQAAERVKIVPNTTHRLGQGGIPGLKAAFISTLNPLLHFFPAKTHMLVSFYPVKLDCLRYLCDANCIAKTSIWSFSLLGCDSRYDAICFASVSMRRSALRKSGRRLE
ncbi:unnamed protein product [Sphagnum jensenii]|uniref:Uncharacterized protein n=1 Tax=Sphagnum jensenii TaxID=128206 RepID=A0ABP1B3J5_9BRYO